MFSPQQELEVIQYVSKMHGKQKYNKQPYLVHLKQVVDNIKFIAHLSRHEEMLTAAYCHDLLEDTSVTKQQLEEKFGSVVARWVSAVSVPSRNHPSYQFCFNFYVDELKFTPAIAIIKLADRLANITQSISTKSVYHLEKYTREDVEYFDDAIQENLTRNPDCHETLALYEAYKNAIAMAHELLLNGDLYSNVNSK